MYVLCYDMYEYENKKNQNCILPKTEVEINVLARNSYKIYTYEYTDVLSNQRIPMYTNTNTRWLTTHIRMILF